MIGPAAERIGRDEVAQALRRLHRDGVFAHEESTVIPFELAPYVGVAWLRRLGKTADLVSASGQDPSVWQVLAGIRFWL